ncbi:VWA domain-containing protein [Microbispora triticiradicis]|nr:VWA domain-containing protein [Microbispora triticiradicis]
MRPGERLDRDFILRLAFDASSSLALVPDTLSDGAPDAPDGVPERVPGGPAGRGPRAGETTAGGEAGDASGTPEGTFVLTLLPPPEDTARSAPRDVVLLLDRSGSMTGWKMVAARRAAARIVDTLTRHDRFAVLSFDSVVERAFQGGLVEGTDRNRYRAVEHLARLGARGGTEMLAPLEEALRLLGERDDDLPGGPARDRVLVLVTDGQVGNEDEILERVGPRLGGARVHTVGIDRAVNAGFLGRLALLGSGRCELVESEDRLDEAMEHIHRRIGSPLVTDVSVRAEGVDLVPGTVTHAGSLYPGVPLVVTGRYRGRAAGALTVHGRTTDGRSWEERAEGRPARDGAARAVWARAHLRTLEDRYAVGDRSLEQQIIDISLRFGVLCRFTAFVAVDTHVTSEGAPEHRVLQPVEPPSGWEIPAAMPMMVAGAPMMARMASVTSSAEAAPGTAADAPIGAVSGAVAPSAPFAAAPPPPLSPAPPPASGAPGGRARPSRGFSAGGFLSHRGSEPAALTDLDGVRPLLTEELTRLGQAESLPERERRRYLADLASRLRVVGQMVGGHPGLLALAADLDKAEWAESSLDDLWRRAVDLLTALAGGSGRGEHGTGHGEGEHSSATEKGRRRPFWKRS